MIFELQMFLTALIVMLVTFGIAGLHTILALAHLASWAGLLYYGYQLIWVVPL